MLQNLPVFTNIWSWWSQATNVEDELPLAILSISLVVIAISWLFCIFAGKQRNLNPPLPPGPTGLPLVGSLPFLGPDLHTHFASLARTYGPILSLRLGNKLVIVVTSPAIARQVLKDHDITLANHDVPIAGRIATYGGQDIFWSPYGPQWRMLRRVCVSGMLSSSMLDSFYALRRREIQKMIRHFYARSGSAVNVGEQIFLTVTNVITSMLWSGMLEGEDRSSLGAKFRQVVAEMTRLVGMTNLSDLFPGLARFDLQGIQRKMTGLTQQFDKIFETIIEQRAKVIDGKGGNEKESKDLLQFLLNLKEEKGDAEVPFTMANLKSILMDIVVAGTDTTSNTVEFALSEMMNNPEVMRKAQQELDTVIGKGNLVEESQIPRLPFLSAVIRETLRLHSTVPLLVPHCPSESCIVGGYTVPVRSQILLNVWAIQRDPSIWEKPSEFDPGRFLNSKLDYSGKDFSYLPFGSGRRICVGREMAERMLVLSLASLVHSFDWKMPEGEKIDVSEKFGIVIKKKIPLVAIATPRLSDPALYE